MWGVLLTPLLIAAFAACAEQSTPEWTENEAKAHLAQQLFDDANIRYDQRIADLRRATLPSRLETSGWTAERQPDSSWLVSTDTALYRLFESGAPFVVLSRVDPTPTVRAPYPSVGAVVSFSSPYIIEAAPSLESCQRGGLLSKSKRFSNGTRGVIVETRFDCSPAYALVEIPNEGSWWVNAEVLFQVR